MGAQPAVAGARILTVESASLGLLVIFLAILLLSILWSKFKGSFGDALRGL